MVSWLIASSRFKRKCPETCSGLHSSRTTLPLAPIARVQIGCCAATDNAARGPVVARAALDTIHRRVPRCASVPATPCCDAAQARARSPPASVPPVATPPARSALPHRVADTSSPSSRHSGAPSKLFFFLSLHTSAVLHLVCEFADRNRNGRRPWRCYQTSRGLN